jgi:hypothetical protein
MRIRGKAGFEDYDQLASDLEFWSDLDAKKLYLYSETNPGARFGRIEIGTRINVITPRGDGVTIDNLHVTGTGAHGVGSGTVKALTVRSCFFDWLGGSILNGFAGGNTTRYGNAVEIYGGCDGFTVENCYIHDVYDAGVTPQADRHFDAGGPPIVQRRIRLAHNVIERCTYSIEYFLSNLGDASEDPSGIEDFVIEGNILRDAAEGFGRHRPVLERGAHIKAWGGRCNNRARGLVIRGNIFWGSHDMLVDLTATARNADGSDSMPTMDGNVFIGRAGQRLGSINQGRPYGLVYDGAGVAQLAVRYPDNVFVAEP